MTRTERLLRLLDLLRQYRQPVTGAVLAQRLDVSLRSIYRDIASLQAQGVPIAGTAGLGYVLQAGFTLPPLMLTVPELEALVLGMRWVARQSDVSLSDEAKGLLGKIRASVPPHLQQVMDTTYLLVPHMGSSPSVAPDGLDPQTALDTMREAMRREVKLQLIYQDLESKQSERTICPVAIGFFAEIRVVAAWCDLRRDFRHFRLDRVMGLALSDERFHQPRYTLFNAWKKTLEPNVRLDD